MVGYLVIAVLSGFMSCIVSILIGAGIWMALAAYVLGLWAGFLFAVTRTLRRQSSTVTLRSSKAAI